MAGLFAAEKYLQGALLEYVGGSLLAGTAIGRVVSGRNYVDTPQAPVEEKKVEREFKEVDSVTASIPRAVPGQYEGARIPPPPSYRDNAGVSHPLNKAAEQLEFVRWMAGEPRVADLMNQAMADAGAANQTVYTPYMFVQELLQRGATLPRVQEAMAYADANFGNGERARATFRRWIVNRVIPGLLTTGATAGATQIYKAGASLLSTGRLDGNEEFDMSAEMNQAAADVDNTGDENFRAFHRVSGVSNFDDYYDLSGFAPLKGSVLNTPSPSAPLGPRDSIIPKSSPSVPYAPPTAPSGEVGLGIFSDVLSGDIFSERPSMAAANTRRTTIPVPAIQSYIPPSQYYTDNMERVQPQPAPVQPRPDASLLKRKATQSTTHDDRVMESYVTHSYDNSMIPALPGGMTASTGFNWKEYTDDLRGINVPLTEAINLVGIGFDAQTSEREKAQIAAAPAAADSEKANESPHVNAANAANPAFANAGKPPTEPAKDKPVVEYHIRN